MSEQRGCGARSGDWSYCPACGGSIDTGYECNQCGRDWLEFHETRQALLDTHTAALEAREQAVWDDAIEAGKHEASALAPSHNGDQQLAVRMILEAIRGAKLKATGRRREGGG